MNGKEHAQTVYGCANRLPIVGPRVKCVICLSREWNNHRERQISVVQFIGKCGDKRREVVALVSSETAIVDCDPLIGLAAGEFYQPDNVRGAESTVFHQGRYLRNLQSSGIVTIP